MNILSKFFASWGEWIRFGLIILGVLGTSWMNTHYVSQGQYEKDNAMTTEWRNETTKNIKDLTAAVSALATTVKVESEEVNKRQDKQLDDHEARLRALEKSTK